MTDLDPVFRRLDPPPGGLAALRRRIAAEEDSVARTHRGRRPIVLVGAAALIALAVLTMGRDGSTMDAAWLHSATTDHAPELVALGLVDPYPEPVRVPPGAGSAVAVQRVETTTPGVMYYRVMAQPVVEGDR